MIRDEQRSLTSGGMLGSERPIVKNERIRSDFLDRENSGVYGLFSETRQVSRTLPYIAREKMDRVLDAPAQPA